MDIRHVHERNITATGMRAPHDCDANIHLQILGVHAFLSPASLFTDTLAQVHHA